MPLKTKNRITLRDVARLAEVSLASASLALSGSPRISDEKKRRVAKVCKEIGYTRDGRLSELMSHLRRIDGRKSGATLAAIVTDDGDEGDAYSELRPALIEELRREASAQGYSLDVFNMSKEGLRPARLRQILKTRSIDGVIVLPSETHEALLDFDFSDFCVVGLGFELDTFSPNRVCPNYIKLMDELMREALDAGYRRIAFLPNGKPTAMRNRLMSSSIDFHLSQFAEGERVSVSEADLQDDAAFEAWMTRCSPDFVVGGAAAYRLLRERIVMGAEGLGFACCDALKLPGEIAGFDRLAEGLGRESVRLAVNGIHLNEKGMPDAPSIMMVDGEFRSGASIAPRFSDCERVGA